ncbi:hypothetical protein DIPPA_20908 [Diplonema papillatum]|nr:hypothetical protein DIPPA_20908 [Diplonema papillatum]
MATNANVVARFNAVVSRIQKFAQRADERIGGDEEALIDECLSIGKNLRTAVDWTLNSLVSEYSKAFPSLTTILPANQPRAYAAVVRALLSIQVVGTMEKQMLSEAIAGAFAEEKSERQRKMLVMSALSKLIRDHENLGVLPAATRDTVVRTLKKYDDLASRQEVLNDYLTLRVTAYSPALAQRIGPDAAVTLLAAFDGKRNLAGSSPEAVEQHVLALQGCTDFLMRGEPKYVVAEEALQAALRDAPTVQKRKEAGGIEMPPPAKRPKPVESSGSPESAASLVKRWVPRKRLLQLLTAYSQDVLAQRLREAGALLRLAVSKSEYKAARFIDFVPGTSKSNPVIIVNFGQGTLHEPLSKVSNTPPSAHECGDPYLAEPVTRKPKPADIPQEDGEDWEPESFAGNALPAAAPPPPNAAPKPAPAMTPYPRGLLVQAHGLASAVELNGRLGRVMGPATNDRLSVLFLGDDLGSEKSIKAINLMPLPPEEDPIVKFDLPKYADRYERASIDTLWHWAMELGVEADDDATAEDLTMLIQVKAGIID